MHGISLSNSLYIDSIFTTTHILQPDDLKVDVSWGYAHLDDNRLSDQGLALDLNILPFGLGATLLNVVRNISFCPSHGIRAEAAASDFLFMFHLPLPFAPLATYSLHATQKQSINENTIVKI